MSEDERVSFACDEGCTTHKSHIVLHGGPLDGAIVAVRFQNYSQTFVTESGSHNYQWDRELPIKHFNWVGSSSNVEKQPSMIEAYAAAVARGEKVAKPVFMRPRDGESKEDFITRFAEAIADLTGSEPADND